MNITETVLREVYMIRITSELWIKKRSETSQLRRSLSLLETVLLNNVSTLSIAYLQADGCLVSLVHDDSDADDEESVLLYKQLCHSAHMEFRVEGLSSGYSKDVHGQVS